MKNRKKFYRSGKKNFYKKHGQHYSDISRTYYSGVEFFKRDRDISIYSYCKERLSDNSDAQRVADLIAATLS